MPASLADSGSLLVIIAVVCLAIGYVFGWLISSIQRGKEESREPAISADEDGQVSKVEIEKVVLPPVAEPAPKPAILMLRQGERPGSLVVEVSGKTVTDSGSLTMQDRRRIESALRRIANWMGLAYQLGDVPQSTASQNAPDLPTGPTVATGAPEISGFTNLDLSEGNNGPRQVSVISGVTNAIADVLQPPAKKDAPLSIVQQIDEIFQAMLEGTDYEDKKIFLAEDPKRGVIVRVGSDVYEGVNAVPDGEVKVMLRSAVAEWERRQETNRRRQKV
jgi:hypothetical protein